MDGGRQLPLTDAQLDRELESALDIEPSPEFLARARMRVSSGQVVESGFSWMDVVSAFRRTAIEPVAVVAVAGIVLAVVVPQVLRDDPAVPQTAASRLSGPTVEATPVESTLKTVVMRADPTGPAPPRRQQSIARAAEEMHTLPLQLSAVLFAEEDRAAFELFVAAVGDGRVPERVVQEMAAEDMADLAIAPLVIEPLPTLARVERQGESQW